ncbi:hypothetical protein ACFQ2M_34925 [Kitasatospora saccharophila]|uniref:hypothetical protein n=1 Tax=Kitasatospora saccharophila TaxID=407973 RepID=UPI003634EA45
MPRPYGRQSSADGQPPDGMAYPAFGADAVGAVASYRYSLRSCRLTTYRSRPSSVSFSPPRLSLPTAGRNAASSPSVCAVVPASGTVANSAVLFFAGSVT